MSLKILVTLDGSELSESVIPTARIVIDESGGDVYLLRVNPPAHDLATAKGFDPVGETQGSLLAGGGMPQSRVRQIEAVTQAAERMRAEALEYLRHCINRFPAGKCHVEVRESAHVADEIIKVAKDLGIDMVAMATHGRTGLKHALLGSVTEAVIRSGMAPVMVIRPKM